MTIGIREMLKKTMSEEKGPIVFDSFRSLFLKTHTLNGSTLYIYIYVDEGHFMIHVGWGRAAADVGTRRGGLRRRYV